MTFDAPPASGHSGGYLCPADVFLGIFPRLALRPQADDGQLSVAMADSGLDDKISRDGR